MNQNSLTYKDLRMKQDSHCFHLAVCHRTLGAVEVLVPMWDENDRRVDPVIVLADAIMHNDYILVTARLASGAAGNQRFGDTLIPSSEIHYIQSLGGKEETDGQ